MTSRRIGIMGGTFDPIHRGHVDLAGAATETLRLTTLFVIPAHVPPHREQPVASPFHRFAMVALEVADHADWRSSDIELKVQGPSYTTTTLAHFRRHGYRATDLFFLLGADAFADIPKWKDYPGILDAAHFVVVSRPRHPVAELPRRLPELAARMVDTSPSGWLTAGPSLILIDAATSDVSSTAIRQRREAGLSLESMVSPRVQQHIERHGLYTSQPPERRAGVDGPDAAAGRLHD